MIDTVVEEATDMEVEEEDMEVEEGDMEVEVAANLVAVVETLDLD